MAGRESVIVFRWLQCYNGCVWIRKTMEGEKRLESFERLPVAVYAEENPEKDISDAFYIARHLQHLDDGLLSERVRVCNNSNRDYRVSIVYSVRTTFAPEHWLIPCVMYDGNPFGTRNSPKGLTHEGRPWVFSGDRCGIPACTISEDRENVVALFSSDASGTSLNCACSVERTAEGFFVHKLIYPTMEAPLSYTGKNRMTEGFREYFDLPSGGSVELSCFLYSGRPRWECYGFASVLPVALSVLHHEHLPAMATADVREVCLHYLQSARNETMGAVSFGAECRDYTHPIGNDQRGGPWEGITLEAIEANPSLNHMMYKPCGMGMGFSSQGMMILRMLLRDALDEGNEEQADEVLQILENWVRMQRPNGLVSLWYPKEREEADPSSLGWGMGEMAKIYALLSERGMECPDFLTFTRKLADFFVEHFSEEDPFGRLWTLDGEKKASGGCNGSFVAKGLLELYEVCGDGRYLTCARKAYEAYFRRDLRFFRCSAGAIDCDSVDKESAFPLIYSGLALWKELGERRYLEMAEQAAFYFLSWMFCYDAAYEETSDFARMGYFTSGGTVVSAEHQCIDPYASVAVPDLLDLYAQTGEAVWKQAAHMIWANTTQCLAGKQGMHFHGMERPAGAQNECFAQTVWSKYRSNPRESRGHMNDFIGIWLCCFKLYTIERVGTLDEM